MQTAALLTSMLLPNAILWLAVSGPTRVMTEEERAVLKAAVEKQARLAKLFYPDPEALVLPPGIPERLQDAIIAARAGLCPCCCHFYRRMIMYEPATDTFFKTGTPTREAWGPTMLRKRLRPAHSTAVGGDRSGINHVPITSKSIAAEASETLRSELSSWEEIEVDDSAMPEQVVPGVPASTSEQSSKPANQIIGSGPADIFATGAPAPSAQCPTESSLRLKAQHASRRASPQFMKMQDQRRRLPSYKMMDKVRFVRKQCCGKGRLASKGSRGVLGRFRILSVCGLALA